MGAPPSMQRSSVGVNTGRLHQPKASHSSAKAGVASVVADAQRPRAQLPRAAARVCLATAAARLRLARAALPA
eukprot:4498910-Prymnesium_polylepis.1